MKLSLEFDWKEVLALAGAILIGLGAGVIGTSFLKQSQHPSIEAGYDYLQKQIQKP